MTPKKKSTFSQLKHDQISKKQNLKKLSFPSEQSKPAKAESVAHEIFCQTSAPSSPETEKSIKFAYQRQPEQQMIKETEQAMKEVIPEIGVIVLGEEIKRPESLGFNCFFAQPKGITPIDAVDLPIPFGGLL